MTARLKMILTPGCFVIPITKSGLRLLSLVMTIKKRRLGIDSDELIDVVNLKCAPEIMDDLWQESGIFPAYHMSKKHWLTLALDSSCDENTVKWVTKISYDLTKKKIRKKS